MNRYVLDLLYQAFLTLEDGSDAMRQVARDLIMEAIRELKGESEVEQLSLF